ncbi:thiamine pyrophosphokinase [Ramicandelaber brevisporus]|nr:thiamine pyrophosphokinase [Ramicandelaber brevisporus]
MSPTTASTEPAASPHGTSKYPVLEHSPYTTLFGQQQHKPYALVFLNGRRPEAVDSQWFAQLWQNARYRVCADGGGNRLHDSLLSSNSAGKAVGPTTFLPDAIIGDLDSLRPEVADFYRTNGVTVTKFVDDYSTDFMKAVDLIAAFEDRDELIAPDDKCTIVALGGLGGRLDQAIHSLKMLYMFSGVRELILVGDGSMATLARGGYRNVIREASKPDAIRTCGVLPLGNKTATVTFEGLRWNLVDHESHIRGMFSTSNHVASDTVVIEADDDVIWTSEFDPSTFA